MKYIVRYGEIGVKSPKIRHKFERRLIENIESELDCEFDVDQGRMILITDETVKDTKDVLDRVFGIVSYSPIKETVTDKKAIKELIEEEITKIISENKFDPEKDKFAVRCRRVGNHDFSSQEMAGYCGSVIVNLTNAKVNLSNPDFTLYVEVRDNKTYIYHEKILGLGGLPVGTQGRVIVLVSSGIDSPVATYMMLKRGCKVTILHCDNDPYVTGAEDKVIKNVKQLQRYSVGSKIRLYKANYGDYLSYVSKEAPPRMTCILCKSGMYQLAESLAKKEKAHAVVDGSSIGQVASQTLNNIEATRYQCRMPIFSPLISMDKIEIEEIAKKIGTYETSIIPDSGCKAVPRYPETHADLDLVNQIIENINQKDKLIEINNNLIHEKL